MGTEAGQAKLILLQKQIDHGFPTNYGAWHKQNTINRMHPEIG